MAWLRYQRNFARTADVKGTVQAERLCRRQSLLGEYFDAGHAINEEVERSESQCPTMAGLRKDGDGDDEMEYCTV